MDKIKRIKELTELCNKHCSAYYNGNELISDIEYDLLYRELIKLETETGYQMSSSPTINVGCKVDADLPKITHKLPMLSLKNITTIEEILDFIGRKKAVMSLKEDGLSIRLYYNKNGDLSIASTRGDGIIATDITSNICCFTNIPLHINTHGKEFIIDGEAICTFDNFDRLNSNLETPYKHPRALASGTISLLDPNEARKRKLDFVAWKLTQGSDKVSYGDQLCELQNLGFDVVPWCYADIKRIENCISMLKTRAANLSHPYDGICIAVDNTSIWESLGSTSKFPHHSRAYKFEQDAQETVVTEFEFSLGKSGQLTPVAHFNSVILDNTEVSKASCHNISYCKNLNLGVGAKVKVIKSMQIIPQIVECVEEGSIFEWPDTCPVCGGPTSINKDNESEVLICTNPNCTGKKNAQLTHFVSKKAMDIKNLSEATLEKFISLDYIKNFRDIYHLSDYYNELIQLDGFGKKSVDKLLLAIEKSRDVKLENFIAALGIPNIGSSAAKTISNRFDGDYEDFINAYFYWHFDWTNLEDFGQVMADSMNTYLHDNLEMINELAAEMRFVKRECKEENDNSLAGLKFCITGSFSQSRDKLKELLEAKGAKFVGSVSKNLDVLFCGEKSGSKLNKAQSLGVRIAYEDELIKMLED